MDRRSPTTCGCRSTTQNQVFLQYDGYQGTQIKQADTVLLIYPLEWPMSTQVAANTLDYYAPRTDPDGPAMTDAIHAVDAAQIGEPGCATHTYLMRSIRPFVRDPFAQFTEARGDKAGAQDPLAGSPAYNFLTGSGGFSQVFTFGLTGLRWREDRVHLDPMLPPQLSGGVTLKGLHWRGRTFDIEIGASTTTVTLARRQLVHARVAGRRRRPCSSAPRRSPRAGPTSRRPTTSRAAGPPRRAPRRPGMYAEAAVDGSTATAWAPTASPGTLTVDLGSVHAALQRRRAVGGGSGEGARLRLPGRLDVHGSALGGDGKVNGSVDARYVRVEATASRTTVPELRELEVR